jgi:hypothetical protein
MPCIVNSRPDVGDGNTWIVRPETATIEIWTNPRKMDRELRKGDTLSSPLFGGWSLAVADVFATH